MINSANSSNMIGKNLPSDFGVDVHFESDKIWISYVSAKVNSWMLVSCQSSVEHCQTSAIYDISSGLFRTRISEVLLFFRVGKKTLAAALQAFSLNFARSCCSFSLRSNSLHSNLTKMIANAAVPRLATAAAQALQRRTYFSVSSSLPQVRVSLAVSVSQQQAKESSQTCRAGTYVLWKVGWLARNILLNNHKKISFYSC